MTTPTSFVSWRSNLRLEGFEVVTAQDGPDALAKAVALRPDLVLLDVRMPGIDGYTICARIRADARLAAVPVLIVTATTARRRLRRLTGWGRRLADQALPPRHPPGHGQDHAQLGWATASPNLPAPCPSGWWSSGRDLGARWGGNRVVGRLVIPAVIPPTAPDRTRSHSLDSTPDVTCETTNRQILPDDQHTPPKQQRAGRVLSAAHPARQKWSHNCGTHGCRASCGDAG